MYFGGDDDKVRVMTPTTEAAKRIEMERAMEIHRKTKLVSRSVRRLLMK
jgi:hypothetical protein